MDVVLFVLPMFFLYFILLSHRNYSVLIVHGTQQAWPAAGAGMNLLIHNSNEMLLEKVFFFRKV